MREESLTVFSEMPAHIGCPTGGLRRPHFHSRPARGSVLGRK
jgi:hypothetical protein